MLRTRDSTGKPGIPLGVLGSGSGSGSDTNTGPAKISNPTVKVPVLVNVYSNKIDPYSPGPST